MENIVKVVIYISWWTLDVLEHKCYEFASYFKNVVLFARAQLILLSSTEHLSCFSRHEIGESQVEMIAWLRSLANVSQPAQHSAPTEPFPKVDIRKQSDSFRKSTVTTFDSSPT